MNARHVQVTEKGRAFVRHVASVFDRYLSPQSSARHASAL